MKVKTQPANQTDGYHLSSINWQAGHRLFANRSAKDNMNNEIETPTPVPLDCQLTTWEEWRGIVYFIAVVIGTSIAIWHWPATQPIAPLVLLGIGVFFDTVSLAARISTAVTGRYSSGFFLIGFAFYLWAWLSYPHPVLIHVSFGRDQGQKDKEHDAE
ncbi:hypothetical protein K8T06_11315 [bacterium]|nr:hypothetical protein [bacterium]